MKIVILLLLTLLFGCTPFKYACKYSKAMLFPPVHKTLELSDGYLANYYIVDKSDGSAENIVFFISGSGFNSLKYYIDKYFDSLKGSYKIFALQKRYVGNNSTELLHKPTAEFHNWNYFDAIVDDNNQFINTILSQNAFAKRVILFGVSEGGTVAAKIASDNKQVSHLVVIGSGGMRFCDELKLLYAQHDAANKFDAIYADIELNSKSIDKLFLGQTYKYMASFLYLNPMDYYSNINIPILLAQGTLDHNCPIESGRMLQQFFRDRNKSNLTFKEYIGCNHVLMKGKENFKIMFFKEMNNWTNR